MREVKHLPTGVYYHCDDKYSGFSQIEKRRIPTNTIGDFVCKQLNTKKRK